HCNGRDEALALPTEESARIALRTQQVIASETGVTNTVDPVGGSVAIERLTDEIERGAEALLARIDRAGGTLTAIETGFIQREIQDSAYKAQIAIESGNTVVVGVNRFTEAEKGSGGIFSVDPEVERRQVARVQTLRASRDQTRHRHRLPALSTAAPAGTTLP